MDNTAKISAAFVRAQKEFRPALKTSDNPFFKSKYADLATCVDAVIDALHNNGIGWTQETSECDDGVIVETVLRHESGETLKFGKLKLPAGALFFERDEKGRPAKFICRLPATPQDTVAALTFARRYSLMAACGIAPEDDDGNSISQHYDAPEKAKPKSKPESDDERMVRATIAIIKDAILNENQDGLRKIVAGIEAKHKVAIAAGLTPRELAAVKSLTVKEVNDV